MSCIAPLCVEAIEYSSPDARMLRQYSGRTALMPTKTSTGMTVAGDVNGLRNRTIWVRRDRVRLA